MARAEVEDRLKRVLVTGASSGIGRALALEFAARGAALAIAARRGSELEKVAAQVTDRGGVPPVVVESDLSRRGEAADLAAKVVSELGAVDVLVNNAGGGGGGLQWAAADRNESREIFEVNV